MIFGFDALRKSYSQLRSDLRQAKRTVALAAGMRDFLRERITLARAQDEIKKALDNRDKSFLEMAGTQIYERPGSPYLKLLQRAGCEFPDLQAQVYHHGLENTLEKLAREGVYLTSEEFKGKKEVVRAGEPFRVSQKDFEPLSLSAGFIAQSSGTRNQPVRSIIDLNYLTLRALATAVFFSAHNLFSHAHAMYDAILPGAGGVNNLLIYAKLGIATDRWFARKIPVNNRMEAMYNRSATSLIVLMGKCFGAGFPRPKFIDTGDLHRIVHWVAEKKRQRKACCIASAASNAARIARVAEEMGQSLEGVVFSASGEPLTDAKREVMERAGATVTSRYSCGPGLHVGSGCGNPLYPDQIHVNQHMLTLIEHPVALADDGPPIHPLLWTTLNPLAPTLLFNVESGDYALLERNGCGCALERVGFALRLHHIRSFEKLTSEGMNYFYGDLFDLFEKVLPAEFGGGPGDYQLVEEEDGRGQTRLSLVVNPDVRDLDEERVLSRLRAALAEGSRGNRFMTRLWHDAGTFRVVRKAPHASGRGKILPLHINR
jgi:hypothetical protein